MTSKSKSSFSPLFSLVINMEYSKSLLEKLYARLTIEDEEIRGVILGNEVKEWGKESFVLIGRFLTGKEYKF